MGCVFKIGQMRLTTFGKSLRNLRQAKLGSGYISDRAKTIYILVQGNTAYYIYTN
jgi:hypothetical protein